MQTVFEAARDLLRGGGTGVLALVLERSGSAPRGQGAKMLIRADGTIFDTIGGGPVEWSVIRHAPQVLSSQETQVMTFDLSGTDSLRDEAICGGGITACLHPLTAADLPALEGACQALSARKTATFLLWRGDGPLCQSFCLSEDGGAAPPCSPQLAGQLSRACTAAGIHEEPRLLYQERLAPTIRVWLIGGGHVAQATAQVAQVAGFQVVVGDDREEFSNPQRFPGARCIVCQAYDALPVEEINHDDYIVVVTRGHKADRIALDWALRTRACYVGMIGSRSKCALIYDALAAQGVPRSQLDQVHAPIGLPIGGQTPGEIGVSIVAQLISERARLAAQQKEKLS